MACHLKSRFGGNSKPFLWMVFLTFIVDHRDGQTLIVEKGMNQLFEVVRVHIVAFDGPDKPHRCAQISTISFRIAQPLLYACGGEADFHEILAVPPGSQFWGSGQGFQNVDIAREVMLNWRLRPGCLLGNREQVGSAVEPLALLVRVQGSC